VFSSIERKRDTTMSTRKNQQNLAVCAGFKRLAGLVLPKSRHALSRTKRLAMSDTLPEAYSLPADNAKSIRPRLSGMQPDHR
jgi:hypothetical protein